MFPKNLIDFVCDWRFLFWASVFLCAYFFLPFDFTDVYSFIPLGRQLLNSGTVHPKSYSWLTAPTHLNFPILSTLIFERIYFYGGDWGLNCLHTLSFLFIFLFWFQLWRPFFYDNRTFYVLGVGLLLFFLWQPFLIIRPALFAYVGFYFCHQYLSSPQGFCFPQRLFNYRLILLFILLALMPFLHASFALILIYLIFFALPSARPGQYSVVLIMAFSIIIGFLLHPLTSKEIMNYFIQELSIEPDMYKPEFLSIVQFPLLAGSYLIFLVILFSRLRTKSAYTWLWLGLPFVKVRLLPFALIYAIPFFQSGFYNRELFRVKKVKISFVIFVLLLLSSSFILKGSEISPWKNKIIKAPAPLWDALVELKRDSGILASYQWSGLLLTKIDWAVDQKPKINVGLDIFNYLNHGQAWKTYLHLFEQADLEYWKVWLSEKENAKLPFSYLLLRSEDKLFTSWPQLPLEMKVLWQSRELILLEIISCKPACTQ